MTIDKENPKYLEKTLPQLYGVHHKSQIEIPSRLLQDIIVWRD
jgi:hypothetical protein